jgi:hypothetical protein
VRWAFLLAGCLVLAACGSGDKRLSRDEYAKRADAICTRFNQQAPSSPTAAKVTTKLVADLANRTLRPLDRTIAQLRSLKPPRDEVSVTRRWLSTLARLRVDVVEIRDRARANDLGGVGVVQRVATRDDDESNRLAAQLGTQVCSKPG